MHSNWTEYIKNTKIESIYKLSLSDIDELERIYKIKESVSLSNQLLI